MYFKTKDKADCCGCGVCVEVCGKKAIIMQADECGFRYPVINKDLCVDCGACESACVFAEKIKDTAFNTEYYAVRSKDDEVVKSSSSGGMLTLMAEEIFSRGGVVYGVVYGENFRVEHKKAINMKQAETFRTSKYVQSDNYLLYSSVKADLLEGKTVLVTGTPCQIAGVNEYFSRSGVNTAKLYTCDNICHGVSSPLTFADYISFLNKYVEDNDRITYFNMRHKDEALQNTVLEVKTEKKGALPQIKDFSYYRLFLNRIANRPACFACKFTSYSRTGDLSVADFWNGKNADFQFDASHGVNEVLINTEKGKELFTAIKENMFCQQVSKEKAWQPHLEYATQKPENYDKFWTEYLSADDREAVIRNYLKPTLLFKIINTVTPVLRRIGLYTLFGKLYRVIFVKK